MTRTAVPLWYARRPSLAAMRAWYASVSASEYLPTASSAASYGHPPQAMSCVCMVYNPGCDFAASAASCGHHLTLRDVPVSILRSLCKRAGLKGVACLCSYWLTACTLV